MIPGLSNFVKTPYTAQAYVADNGIEWPRWAILSADGHGIATVDPVGNDPQEVEQRAKLFAAAPEILAALKQFVNYAQNGNHPYWGGYLKTIAGSKMLSAITKAEGGA